MSAVKLYANLGGLLRTRELARHNLKTLALFLRNYDLVSFLQTVQR
jgi:hypothetical protein